MKDMAAMQPGMSYFGEMPDTYNLVVNTEHPLIKKLRDEAESAIGDKVAPLATEVEEKNKQASDIRSAAKDGKLSAEEQQQVSDIEKSVEALRTDQEKIIKDYAATVPQVKQLIDLALLGNGLLKGQRLSDFIARSVSLL